LADFTGRYAFTAANNIPIVKRLDGFGKRCTHPRLLDPNAGDAMRDLVGNHKLDEHRPVVVRNVEHVLDGERAEKCA
jgi:hypothetical protein